MTTNKNTKNLNINVANSLNNITRGNINNNSNFNNNNNINVSGSINDLKISSIKAQKNSKSKPKLNIINNNSNK